MIPYDSDFCYLTDRCRLLRVITEVLPAVIYTLKYVRATKEIEISYVSENFSKITGCDVDKFINYRQFYGEIVVNCAEFFNFLQMPNKNNRLFLRKYKVNVLAGGCNVLLDYCYAEKISDDVTLYNGVIINNTEEEIRNLALSIGESRLRLALEASGDGFFDWTNSSSEIFCDKITVDLFGISQKSTAFRDFYRVICKKNRKYYSSTIRKIFNGNLPSFSFELNVHSPNDRWLCVAGKAITFDQNTGRPSRIAGTVRDITATKNTLLERERMNEILEARVIERTKQLEAELATKTAAEKQLIENLQRERELNDAKSVFVNMVSHEFRTPLSVIQCSVDLMRTHFEQLPALERVDLFNDIQKSIQRMTRFMDDMFILGKVQTNQLKFSPKMVNILIVCHDILDDIELVSSNSRERIIFEIGNCIPNEIFADAGLLTPVISNLLSNALKYSADDRKVTLRLEYNQTRLEIYVGDDGIGIPKSEINDIFKLFYRGSNVSNKPGIGVGMFIIKHCIKLHHGTIEFANKDSGGAIFKISIPVVKEESEGK